MSFNRDHWKPWMVDFQHGTFLFLPKEPLFSTALNLREKFDSLSAKTSPPHLTITQPLKNPLNSQDEELIQTTLSKFSSFEFQIGPAVTSPNKQLLWLDVSSKEAIVEIRDRLHETGLFKTDLPLTKGFIPHLTLSEARRDPTEVEAILTELNKKDLTWKMSFDSLSFSIPNDEFIFEVTKSFELHIPR